MGYGVHGMRDLGEKVGDGRSNCDVANGFIVCQSLPSGELT